MAAFEGVEYHPYLDTNKEKLPTIGYGINLTTVTGAIKTLLVRSVKEYYASHYSAQIQAGIPGYSDVSNMSETQVVNMLLGQARRATVASPALKAITESDALELLDLAYKQAYEGAANVLGVTAWGRITEKARIVLADIAYNAGIGKPATTNSKGERVKATGLHEFAGMLSALRSEAGPDYIRAGFELLNSKRSSVDVGYARSLANYQYLTESAKITV